jgi:hypothetical protein
MKSSSLLTSILSKFSFSKKSNADLASIRDESHKWHILEPALVGRSSVYKLTFVSDVIKHCSCTYKDIIFVFGGKEESGSYSSSILRFNTRK